jgi:hypothetical protein
MDLNTIFKDTNSVKIWQNYFKRVDKIIAVLGTASGNETRLELQNHLYESFLEQQGKDEMARLMTAIENLGDPEDFLKIIVSEKLLQKGTRTLSPLLLFKGLLYNISGSLKSLLRTSLFMAMYLLIFIFGLMSLTKFIIPQNVGLFLWPDGSWNFGIISYTLGAREILGFWIVPISIIIVFILYYMTTQLLKLTLKKE